MPVLSEISTMTEVAQGTSLARFGHGELMIMAGEDAEHQKWDAQLDDELWGIFTSSRCLTAIPPFDPPGWDGFLEDYEEIFESKGWYGSSFVSRHDWVPWTEEYRKLLHSLWDGKSVHLIASNAMRLAGARWVKHVQSPPRNAYQLIDALTAPYISDLTILSCGPAGTILADRLAKKGYWAVDLGNFGRFL